MHGVVNLAAVLVAYFVVPIGTDRGPGRLVLDLVVMLAAVGVAGWVVLREVRRRVEQRDQGLRGRHLVLALEFALVGFALLYYTLAVNVPGQMEGIESRLDALYFSATTMTTTGYGDIVATGQFARGLVTTQLLFDVVFVAAVVGLIQAGIQRRRGSRRVEE